MISQESGGGGYPRPQFRRQDWVSLNGRWDFSLDPYAVWQYPSEVVWRSSIEVPFAPETPRSGIGDKTYFQACWYRRPLARLKLRAGERCFLHFGAVDDQATVWIDGVHVGMHEGGYTPFSFDVTDFMQGVGPFSLVVRAVDIPDDLQQPRGKQDWQPEPHWIWYPRTSGIWQTVWMERVPASRISEVVYTPNFSRWEIGLYVGAIGPQGTADRLRATLRAGNRLLAQDVYTITAGEVHRRIALSDPGIDDSRNELLWSPASPTLIDVRLELLDRHEQVLDTVDSYTALREVAIQGDRITLNGRALQLRFVLDH